VRRIACRFSGRVQGVGFRATARSIAISQGVVGWVRNEPDGTVTLEAQGPTDQLETLLERIGTQMGSLISDIQQHELAPLTEESAERGFDIRVDQVE